MRLDCNSYIFEPLCYDPLQRFHQHNRSYGYRRASIDPELTNGMQDFVDDYVHKNPSIKMTMEKNRWEWPGEHDKDKMSGMDFAVYSTNFEIVRLDAFRRSDVQKWLAELTNIPESVIKYRWCACTICTTRQIADSLSNG
jgi:mannosyltransferase